MADTHSVVKRIALVSSIALVPVLAVAVLGMTACSQSTAHPNPLGDCKVQGCNPDLGAPVGIQDAQVVPGTGSVRTDGGGDASVSQDAGADAALDSAGPVKDTGAGD